MFEQASRLRIRFATEKGNLTVEDLWSLSLVHLDSIAVHLSKLLEENPRTTFLSTQGSDNQILKLSFDIAYYILSKRLEEDRLAKLTEQNKQKRKLLTDLLHEKEQDSLKSLTLEELKAQIAELDIQ
jgi:hypothetical protein